MKGKIGLVVGLGVGYVLGTRAGRERYEQISTAAKKLWELDVVQDQVDKVGDFAKSSAMALPRTLWNSAVKLTHAASGSGTAGQRVDRTTAAAKKAAPAVRQAAATTAEAVGEAIDDATETATGTKAASGKTTTTRSTRARSTTSRATTTKKK